jgi:TolB-like protein/Tfp pilus assembly protein PilF
VLSLQIRRLRTEQILCFSVEACKLVSVSTFFAELQRRKVYRVAAAYVIAAGFIIQIASAVFPAWELPNWSLRLLVVLILAGFPIALIFAWAFDITPSGIERTPAAETQAGPALARRRRNIILLIAAGLIISIAAGFFLLPRASARKIDKSIAVLPFENLSDDKENAYFADGVQDDILTNLSKIGDLKVISRTSVMSYRIKPTTVREIGKALGVSTVLEGSVRREGNRVRVSVQLINANNDEHLWANNYDRDLTDVFAIQTDLAREIAGALQAKLSPSEKAYIGRKPTRNSEAYLLGLQARELFRRPDRFRDDAFKSEELLEKATRLDPNFAMAFAQLGATENWIFHSYDSTPARRDKAKAAVDTAIRLDPEMPEAHLTLGFFYYYCDRDDGHYQRALDEFAIAQRGLPNDAEVYMAIGAIERRQGKWAQSTQNLERAAALDPKNAWVMQNLAFNYQANRKFEMADKTLDRGLAAAPESFSIRGLKAKFALEARGDFSVGEQMLATAPPGFDPQGVITFSRMNFLTLQRKFADALAVLQQWPQEQIHGDSTAPTSKSFIEGTLYWYQGDKVKARAALERARPFAEQAVRESPDDAGRHLQLAWIFVGLGDKEEGIREAKRAVELQPESKDAFEGPQITLVLAQVYAWTGEKDQAFQLVEHSLTTPNGVTVSILKLDPIWDPLRSDPRFQALIDKYSAKA